MCDLLGSGSFFVGRDTELTAHRHTQTAAVSASNTEVIAAEGMKNCIGPVIKSNRKGEPLLEQGSISRV